MPLPSIYALVSLTSAVILAFLVAYALKIDPRSKTNIMGALFFSLLFLWSALEFIERTAADEYTAFLAVYGIIAVVIMIPPVLIHFSIVFPWKRKEAGPPILIFYALSFLLLSFHLSYRVFVSGIERYFAGYGMVPGPQIYYLYTYVALSAFASLGILLNSYSHARSEIAVEKLKYLIIAIGIVVIFVTATGFFPLLYGDIEAYPLTTPSFIVAGLITIYAMKKYNVFLPETGPETGGKKGGEEGVRVLPREIAFLDFYESVRSGKKGMCLTTVPPAEIKEEMDAKDLPVMDISEIAKKKGEKRSLIPFMITDALMEKNVVVLLDGMDQILDGDEYQNLLMDLKRINPRESLLIISETRDHVRRKKEPRSGTVYSYPRLV